jgi:hypothetical protein
LVWLRIHRPQSRMVCIRARGREVECFVDERDYKRIRIFTPKESDATPKI